MSAERGFVLFLALTLVLLALDVWSGHRARRRLHLMSVAATLFALGTTIWFAEKMGAHYDLEAAGLITPVHLWLAKGTVFAYLGPIVTGVLTLRNATWRPRHRVCAFVALVLTVATAVTGTWMLLASEPLP